MDCQNPTLKVLAALVSRDSPVGSILDRLPAISNENPRGEKTSSTNRGSAFSNHMGLVLEVNSAVLEFPSTVDFGHGKIQNRARVIELRLPGPVQHQAHAATVAKRQARRRFEEQAEP
jgi:hypothetical protein